MAELEHRDLDLNLLIALDALLEERHVTRAATRLGQGQPTLSRTLARLRHVFDDPLLVRSGQGYLLSPRAESLQPKVRMALARARDVFAPVAFDPATAQGPWRLAAPDYVVFLLVPRLLERLREEAPGIDLIVTSWDDSWAHRLAIGDVDATFGHVSGKEHHLRARSLLADRFVTVLRPGHPALRGPWTAKRFARLDHAIVSVDGRGRSQVDDALAALGLERRIVLRTPFVVVTPLLVLRSDVVLSTSHRLALGLSAYTDMVIRKPPVTVADISFPLVWHDRTHADPMQRWLRNLLIEEADALPLPPAP